MATDNSKYLVFKDVLDILLETNDWEDLAYLIGVTKDKIQHFIRKYPDNEYVQAYHSISIKFDYKKVNDWSILKQALITFKKDDMIDIIEEKHLSSDVAIADQIENLPCDVVIKEQIDNLPCNVFIKEKINNFPCGGVIQEDTRDVTIADQPGVPNETIMKTTNITQEEFKELKETNEYLIEDVQHLIVDTNELEILQMKDKKNQLGVPDKRIVTTLDEWENKDMIDECGKNKNILNKEDFVCLKNVTLNELKEVNEIFIDVNEIEILQKKEKKEALDKSNYLCLKEVLDSLLETKDWKDMAYLMGVTDDEIQHFITKYPDNEFVQAYHSIRIKFDYKKVNDWSVLKEALITLQKDELIRIIEKDALLQDVIIAGALDETVVTRLDRWENMNLLEKEGDIYLTNKVDQNIQLPIKVYQSIPLPIKNNPNIPLPTKDNPNIPLPIKDNQNIPLPIKDSDNIPIPIKDDEKKPLPIKDNQNIPLPIRDGEKQSLLTKIGQNQVFDFDVVEDFQNKFKSSPLESLSNPFIFDKICCSVSDWRQFARVLGLEGNLIRELEENIKYLEIHEKINKCIDEARETSVDKDPDWLFWRNILLEMDEGQLVDDIEDEYPFLLQDDRIDLSSTDHKGFDDFGIIAHDANRKKLFEKLPYKPEDRVKICVGAGTYANRKIQDMPNIQSKYFENYNILEKIKFYDFSNSMQIENCKILQTMSTWLQNNNDSGFSIKGYDVTGKNM